jgi:hypothetical protein
MSTKCIVCNQEIDKNTDLVSMNYSKIEKDSIYKKLIYEKNKPKDKMLGKKRGIDNVLKIKN